MPQYWNGPYRIRTWLRSHMPWFIINTGIVDKGENCEKENGHHEWYNKDNKNSCCYHCNIERDGQLWKEITN